MVSARMQSVEKIKADLKEAKEAGDISLEEFLAELKKLRPIVADRPADARKKDAIDSHCMHLHPGCLSQLATSFARCWSAPVWP